MAHNFNINGLPEKSYWGASFLDGTYQELVKIPTRKTGLEMNWPDEDGTEVDLTANNYESRQLALPMCIYGNTGEALLMKYNAFGDMIRSGVPIVLDSFFLNRRYTLRYTSISNVVWYNTVVTFTLNLMDDYPTNVVPIPS